MYKLDSIVIVIFTTIFITEPVTIKTASAALTGGPVSVSALVGENALFHCNGSGTFIVWRVDGLHEDEASIIQRGISSIHVALLDTVQSTLTVPATLVNNGTTVQCVLYPGEVTSNNATLTVLPGIGPVANVRFINSFSIVAWDPPATAGVLSGLSYIVIIMNNNTGQVIVNGITNNTNYPLHAGLDMLCQYYTANVTAFSSQYHSDSVVTGQRVPGDYYNLASVPRVMVASYSTTQSAVTFTVSIEEESTEVCPGHDLLSVTYPKLNPVDRTTHDEIPLAYAGEVNYTVIVNSGYHCTCDFNIIFDDREEVDILTVFFSSYNVQDCDVSSDQHTSSILVECTFAINSTAPGIVVIQDADQSQYTINKTLQRLVQDSDKGSVNITGLPAGEYSVRVYDNSPATDTSAAYQHSQLIHIMELPSPSPTSIILLSVSSSSYSMLSSFSVTNSVTPSVVFESATAYITVVGVVVGVTIAIIFMVVMVCIFLCRYQELNKFNKVKNDQLTKQQGPVYADLHHSTNPPASPLPVEPVQYTDIKKQTDNTTETTQSKEDKGLCYAQVQHSTNRAVPPLPVEPVQYSTVKKPEPVQSKTPPPPVDCDPDCKDALSSFSNSSVSRNTSETTVADKTSDSLPSHTHTDVN